MFTAKDLAQIAARGSSIEIVEQQISNFVNGFEFMKLNRAATISDGIVQLSQEAVTSLEASYDIAQECGLNVSRFVPASGAASRMFKELYEYANQGIVSPAVTRVVENISDFAFYDDLLSLGIDMSDPKAVVNAILEHGLDYGHKPKALIKFHRYDAQESRTALEEQMVEAALYGKNYNTNKCRIHFTVSPEHQIQFENLVESVREVYQERFGVTYDIVYSVQSPSTDTISVDMQNVPLRDEVGNLIFRPAGHGALIHNLAMESGSDLIFIKTIDNVQTDLNKFATVSYKKALAAMAITLQARIFEYIRQIDQGEASAEEIIEFLDLNVGYRLSNITSYESLRSVLDRPLRVCGMVKNEGEPGGGPFWVTHADGAESLQIVESSQISPDQKNLMSNATHFNPVDIVCSLKRHDGSSFDPLDYVDHQAGFISIKSKDGVELKAQELPGLWNGAMSDWNTIFVEVPIKTFSPVKSVVDLLRSEHQM